MSLTLNNAGRLLPHLSSISRDGGYSLVFFHSRLAVYSLATKLQINSYQINQASNFINVKHCDSTADIFYALDSQSTLHTINWRSSSTSPVESSTKLPSLDNGHEYIRIVNFQNSDPSVVIFLTKSKDNGYSIVKVDLSNLNLEILNSWTGINHYSISSNDQNVAFIDTHDHKLHILSFDPTFETILDSYSITYIHKTPITTIAISNDVETPYVALASSSGIIQLIYVNVQSKTSTQRILKWHINQPLTLNFTPDNEYLISGGSEKVLVFWNVVNEKQQFLPRMNGSIVDLIIDSKLPSLYGLTLSLIDGESQFLILSSTDLVSKFDVSSPRILNGLNDFQSQYFEKKLNYNPNDLINVKNGPIFKNIQKELKYHSKSNPNNNKFKYIQNSLKSNFKINPINDQLYIPSGSYVQIFNLTRPSDSNIISIAPLVQQYGKVGNEQKIKDPVVKFIQFTQNGHWMITLDVECRGEIEENVGTPEEIETLRFWKLINNEYQLQTKIVISQNGKSLISCILTGPLDYFNGESLITLDSKGEIKLWRPNSQNVWTLRKFHSFGNDIPTSSTPLCSWSNDGSLISIVMGSKIKLLDINSFNPITLNLNLELQDNHPNFIKFLNDGKFLLLNTKTHVIIYDILNGLTKWGLIIGDGNSIVNATNNEIAIIGRFVTSDNEINTKVSIWDIKDDEIVCNWSENYDGIIVGVEYNLNWSKWVIVDINAKIGTINSPLSTSNDPLLMENSEDIKLDNLLNNARVINQNKKSNISDLNDQLGLKNGVFDLMLTDLEGLSVDILFDRIVKVL